MAATRLTEEQVRLVDKWICVIAEEKGIPVVTSSLQDQVRSLTARVGELESEVTRLNDVIAHPFRAHLKEGR